MPVGAIISGVASVAGAVSSIVSGGKAKKAIVKSAKLAAETQTTAFDKAAALQAPFVEACTGALGVFSDIFVGGDTEKLENLPGISFLREQGEQGLGRIQAARGGFLSGAAVKEGIRFNQGLASTQIAQATDPLFRIAGLGQASAGNVAAQGLQTGRGVAQTQLIAGQARADQAINIGSSINTGINNTLFAALSGGLFSGGGGGGGSPQIQDGFFGSGGVSFATPSSVLNSAFAGTPLGN